MSEHAEITIAPDMSSLIKAFKEIGLQAKKLNRKFRRLNKALKPAPLIHNGKKPRR